MIIGAGISGSVAALSALHHGASRVLIVEKGDKVGETTSQKIDFTENRGLDDIVKELKLPINHISYKSKWYSPSNSCFSLKSKIADYWIKRGPSSDSFEVKTMSLASEKGAEILLNSKVINCRKNTVTIKRENRIDHIQAKTIVDAGGLFSNVIRSVNPEINNKSIKKIIGYGVAGYNFDMEEGVPEIFFDNKSAIGSYALLCKDPHDGMGYLIQGFEGNNKINPAQSFESLLKNNEVLQRRIKNAEIIQKIHGTLYITNQLPQMLRSHNVLLVGDSARLMDPFLHYGVKPAIISGYLSGK